MSTMLREDDILIVLNPEHPTPATAEEFGRELQEECERYLDDANLGLPFGSAVAARQFVDAITVIDCLDPNVEDTAFTVRVNDPKAWLKTGLGKDEVVAVLTQSVENLAESVKSIQMGGAVTKMLDYCQSLRDEAFENKYIVIPTAPEGLLRRSQMKGNPLAEKTGTAFLYGMDTVAVSVFEEKITEGLPAHLQCVTVAEARKVMEPHILELRDIRTTAPPSLPTPSDIRFERQLQQTHYTKRLINAISHYGDHDGFISVLHARLGDELSPSTGMQTGHQAPDAAQLEAVRTYLHSRVDNDILGMPDSKEKGQALAALQQRDPVAGFATGVAIGADYEGSNIANTQTWQTLHTPSEPEPQIHRPRR